MTIDTSKVLTGSWRTSAIAVLAAVYGFFQLYMIADWHHFYTTVIQNPLMVVLLLMTLLGWQSKDKAVTGGTVAATDEAKTRVGNP